MQRTIQPELLDSLPPDHPDALHNRRDLRLTNRVMGNHRWIAKTLPKLLRPTDRILELGAGTGELSALLESRGLAVDAIDFWPRPDSFPPSRQWHQSDLRTFPRYGDYTVFVANLILHQFHDSELAQLGAALAPSARVVIAAEPARSRASQLLYRTFAPLFGANRVSLHDAHVSIHAGFRRDELPRALGLSPADWHLDCGRAPIGAYHLLALRRP
jgi:Methylase involved in ubiquinone/menaquinone biosynthesis